MMQRQVKHIRDARREYEQNDPPIEINQMWVCYLPDRDEPFRRMRILAKHPDDDNGRLWIAEEMTNTIHGIELHSRELRLCPELNLRYVFQLETE